MDELEALRQENAAQRQQIAQLIEQLALCMTSTDDAGARDPGCSVAARSATRGAGFFIVLSSAIAALVGRRRRRR